MRNNDVIIARVWSYVGLGAAALVFLCLGIGVWATQTTIAGAVMASGVIDLDRNRQVVQHPQGGVVAQIAVRDGDFVNSGDLLIRLNMDSAQADLAYAQEQLFGLRARMDRLRAEYSEQNIVVFEDALIAHAAETPEFQAVLEGQRVLFAAGRATRDNQARQLRQRQEQVRARVVGIEAQITALDTQMGLIATALVNQNKLLSQGLSQSAAVLQLNRERATLEGRLGELISARAEARESIIETDIDIVQRATEYRQTAIAKAQELEQPLQKFTNDARQLQAQIAQAEVRAPVSGVVHGMHIQTQRSVLRAAEPLLFLIPQDQPLIIAARVTPQHIDQVHIGQDVKLRLSALDQRLTPEVLGTVMRIAADAVEDERSGERYFQTQIILKPGELDKLPTGAVLLPGMPVETFIQTTQRSPMAFLIKPVVDYFARAFRES
ncbi:MAG: HlyD family type I secretion periplasmic adaptor subunit [Sulfitobacter sp.]